MSSQPGPVPPRVVPTLTEVVQVTTPRPFGAAPAAAGSGARPVAATRMAVSQATAGPMAGGRPAGAAPSVTAPSTPMPSAPVPAATAPAAVDQALAQRLLLDVQRQVDLLLEQRLRETLAPLIARLTDDLVSASREQLASTLRELITQAVAREMARRREP
jgi:hypothetical protein